MNRLPLDACRWRGAPRKSHETVGLIDAARCETSVGQRSQPGTIAATKVQHVSAGDALAAKDGEQTWACTGRKR